MNTYTKKEVLEFTSENDVKFIRLAFCDMHGVMKNIAIMNDELPKAFENGVAIDASLINGFESAGGADLYLYPSPETLSVLPWRPKHGRVVRFFCHVKDANKRNVDYDTRSILLRATERAKKLDLACLLGSACSFYLFELDELGNVTKKVLDNAGYLDVAPPDKGENVRREVCLTLEEMDVIPKNSYHGADRGQNIIVFKKSDALTCADNLATFKSVVKNVAARNGLFASLMPVPPGGFKGNNITLNISLFRHGTNLMKSTPDGRYTPEAQMFAAGILKRIYELSVFLNPSANSYKRFFGGAASPDISWASNSRANTIRMTGENGRHAHIELNTPDIIFNPYIALALIIHAGLDGIEGSEAIPAEGVSAGTMPKDLGEAIEAARASEFIQKHIPKSCFESYYSDREKHWDEFRYAENSKEFDEKYFELM